MTGYRIMVRHLVGLLGSVKLVEMKVRDVSRKATTATSRFYRVVEIP